MLPGFPDWDAPVHNILQKHFADLVSILCFYAKQGGADAGGASLARSYVRERVRDRTRVSMSAIVRG